MNPADNKPSAQRKPPWIRSRFASGPEYQRLRQIVDQHRLHTVCEAATCPNMGECWSCGTATLLILGDICTRNCRFCNVNGGKPEPVDLDEPRRVAQSVALMKLDHVVITSVTRDDLPDGGAAIWAQTIRSVRAKSPGTAVESLVPDFQADPQALDQVIAAHPAVFGHNMETVRSLYPAARPQADYDRSLQVLTHAKAAGLTTKTGIMLGLGETDDQVEQTMRDVIETTRCDILTIGQYLQPSPDHLPVARWVTPPQFEELAALGRHLGFRHVESAPLVRSSYHAADQAASV